MADSSSTTAKQCPRCGAWALDDPPELIYCVYCQSWIDIYDVRVLGKFKPLRGQPSFPDGDIGE